VYSLTAVLTVIIRLNKLQDGNVTSFTKKKIVTVFRAVTFVFALPIILYRVSKKSINCLVESS